MKGVAFLMALLPLAASAATITVNSTADNTTAGNGQCTLREAIANVNAAADTTRGDCTAGSGAGDTIVFALGLPPQITLRLGQLSIVQNVTILGRPGPRISGANQTRVFEITAGTTRISDVTIMRGVSDFGGGISVHSGASLKLTNCTLMRNTAPHYFNGAVHSGTGGAIYNAGGTLSLTNCKLLNNAAGPSGTDTGGAIYNAGTMSLTDCLLVGNRGGDAVSNDSNGTATLTNCRLLSNYGGWENSSAIYNAGTMAVTGCTLRGNGVGFAFVGAIFNDAGNLTLTNSTLRHNSTIYGGGALTNGGGMATVSHCTLRGNVVLSSGAAVASGGAIGNTGSMTITNSTFVDNKFNRWTGFPTRGSGSAIRNNGGALTLINCSIQGKQPADRTALTGSNMTLVNTIVAYGGGARNCDGGMISGGHNISSDGSCFSNAGTDLVNTNPMLAPLANYGGSTQALALCTGPRAPKLSCTGRSPAIDAGDDTVTGPPNNLSTDQRGLPRLSGAHVDIGAYEVQ